MNFDFEAIGGMWFSFFNSHQDVITGEIIYDEPNSDARVQIRSIAPFIEELISKRKKSKEYIYNPRTKAMEMISYYPELSFEEAKRERDDTWDYAIIGLENFKDAKTGEILICNRENKIKLMRIPVFDRFIARCLQIISDSGVKPEESEKNS